MSPDRSRRPKRPTLPLWLGLLLLAPLGLGAVCGGGGGGGNGNLFEDVSAAAGMTFLGNTYGSSWGDANGDGWPDLFLSNHHGSTTPPSLYLNNRDGTFTDVGATLAAVSIGDTHGAAWGDYDNDGDQDLLEVAGGGDPNHLFTNDGSATFSEDAVAFNVDQPDSRGRSALWWDWNGDGLLDVVFSNIARFPGGTMLIEQTPTGPWTATPYIYNEQFSNNNSAQLADLDGDGVLDLVFHGSNTPRVYETSTTPFPDIANALGLGNNAPTLQDVLIADFSGDAMPDVYLVQKNGESPSLIQTNATTIEFTVRPGGGDVGLRFATSNPAATATFMLPTQWEWKLNEVNVGSGGIQPPALTFTLDPANPDHHGIAPYTPGANPRGVYAGWDDVAQEWVVMINSASNPPFNTIITTSDPIASFTPVNHTVVNSVIATQASTLMEWTPAGYVDATVAAGLDTPHFCGSGTTGDFDNDGDVDIYLTCEGLLENLPNLFLENQGDGTFSAKADGAGAAGSSGGRADAPTAVDYDNDGFLDLFIPNGDGAPPWNQDGPHQLYRNKRNGNSWLELDLEGVVTNRDGIGARVTVTTPDAKVQLRESNGGAGKFSQNHARLHFGLGSQTQVDELRIAWPSGVVQTLGPIPAEQILHVVEPSPATLQGAPTYVPGSANGVFVWQETFDGPLRIRTSGDGAGSAAVDVRVVADRPLDAASGVGLEGADALASGTAGVALTSDLMADEDGVDLWLAPRTRAALAVSRDGVVNPRLVAAGLTATPLSPAGWVVPAGALPVFPALPPGEMQISLGHGTTPEDLEARWVGGTREHDYRIDLFSSEPLVAVTPQSIDAGDVFLASNWAVAVAGLAGIGSDGFAATLAPGADIAFLPATDGLFRPNRINVAAGDLGFPNASLLPLASPDGAPSYDAGSESGLFLWSDASGWHLRATGGAAGEHLVGALTATLAFPAAAGAGLEGGDLVDTASATVIGFDLTLAAGDEDGVDFDLPAGASVELDLDPASSGGVELLNVGGDRWPVAALPLEIGGW